MSPFGLLSRMPRGVHKYLSSQHPQRKLFQELVAPSDFGNCGRF